MTAAEQQRSRLREIERRVEHVGGSIAGLLGNTATRSPTVPGLVATGAGGLALSWADVDRAVAGKATELLAAGLRPGDRVATLVPTSVELAISLLAILRADGVAVPLTPRLDPAVTAALLEHSGATLLIAGNMDTSEMPDGVRVLGSEFSHDERADEPASSTRRGADLAVLAYVAGVDSQPRAAMYSHRALLANAMQLRAVLPATAPGGRMLLGTPLTHLYGLVAGLLTPLAAESTLLLSGPTPDSPTPDPPTAQLLLAASRAGRATMIVGSPAIYTELSGFANDQLDEPLAGVSHLLCGPSPAHPRVHAAIRRATGLDLVRCYGRAGVAGVLSSTLANPRGGYGVPSAVGWPLPGTEVSLVDSGGEHEPAPLDPADPADVFTDDDVGTGLIAVRGPALSSGYWPGGEFGPDTAGWSRTGDVGYFDSSAALHLADRVGDVLVVRGFNVYPHEVEDVIAALTQVADVAVTGLPGQDGAESVQAVVVPTVGSALTSREVIVHCAAELPAYKVPSIVRFVAELPHTPTGLLRRKRAGQ